MAARNLSAPDAPHDQPGAHKTIRRTRRVPVTINGRTHTVRETYDATVPVLPPDWERTLLRGTVTAAVLVVLASLAWTTASIGGLLALAVVPAIAYAAASVFDASWIVCMAAEWLARYDPDRARTARQAGWIALLVSMAAVLVHGWLIAGSPSAGIIGATVSLLAKGLWTVVMRLTSYPMDDLHRQWLAADRAEVGVELAVLRETRNLDRVRAAIAAERAALRLPGHAQPQPEEDTRAAGTIRAAVRAAADTMPDATVDELVQQLADAGIDITPDAVRAALGHARTSPDTPGADVIQLDNEDAASIAEVVRRCLEHDLTDVDRVLSVARRKLPGVKDDSVRRELQRALRKRATG